MMRLEFRTTNNEKEHKVILVGLTMVEATGVKEVDMKVDFQVVVNQVMGE